MGICLVGNAKYPIVSTTLKIADLRNQQLFFIMRETIKHIAVTTIACALLMSCVTGTVEESDAENQTTVISGTENGHDWVDMGTSIKWSVCNIGANGPKEAGDYFAWGEVSPKEEYNMDNCSTYDKEFEIIAGNQLYDAACVNWGGKWRMPTRKDFEELLEKCDWQLCDSGIVFTANNGNTLYFPPTMPNYGRYWTATPDRMRSASAFRFASYAGVVGVNQPYLRYCGFCIRPVTE